MTCRSLYTRLLRDLQRPAAAFELRQLFLQTTGWDARLPAGGETELPEYQALWIIELAARLSDGYPLQYLLGEWEFYGLDLKVGPGVLIPRPDTERLVDLGLALLKDHPAPVTADLCAGSGGIGIALCHHMPTARCYAVELSDQAMDYLKANIARHHLEDRVIPMQADVRKPLCLPELDLILSNPPYLSREELRHLPPEVAAEPEMALDGGEDGLDFYWAISEAGLELLKPGGCLMFEVGHTQADQVADLMIVAGFTDIEITPDLGGIPRCVRGFKPIESR